MSNIAVLDIGKTNAKVLLIDGSTGAELAVERTPNRVIDAPPYPHHNVEGLFSFVLDALKSLSARHRIDAISITAHGGSAVLVAEDGSLALPMLDYEFSGIDETRATYEKVRPPFDETGSPPLPAGLNVGAQLFWQQTKFPNEFARAKWIVTYPQYWSMRLTGKPSVEPTSLGCHTDVWKPWAGDFSSLVDRMGWRAKFPPVRPASDVLGPVLPKIAAAAGLAQGTPVTSGIHDSNASLLPYLQGTEQPFSVASTGTWIIAFAVGGALKPLDAARDTLANVNALGQPTPTARFMGGRSMELLCEGPPAARQADDLDAVLRTPIMARPSIVAGCGPYPAAAFRWLGAEQPSPGIRAVAASFYCALMTAASLDLLGAQGPIHVDGPFAQNSLFLQMLAAATGRNVVAQAGAVSGPAAGAALLVEQPAQRASSGAVTTPHSVPTVFSAYAEAWRAMVQAM